jgi:hypothetical protein
MRQKSGNKKNEITFVNVARLMLEKAKKGITDIYNNLYSQNHVIFSDDYRRKDEKC